MRKPGGYAFITSPEPSKVYFDKGLRCESIPEGTYETDTVMCAHCDKQFHIKPKMRPEDMGGLCKQCMKFECPKCVGKGCTPLEKRLAEWEDRARVLRSYGL